MREAMAAAPVGDDVFGEDPTIQALEARAAELLGTEASLYVPSGSMANQIAIMVHTRPGDDVLVGNSAHSYLFESGAGGALAGIQFTTIGPDGRFCAKDVSAAIHPSDDHFSPTRLVIAENTHNRSGGRIFPLDDLKAVRATADEHGLRFHIDGARLMNAAVATGTPPEQFGGIAHSLSLCLSKALGAPVGSVVAGSTEFVRRAHRYRKMLGGGMRQAGIIAAGGLYAIENHIPLLVDDHQRTKRFAEGAGALPGIEVDLGSVETNIVVLKVDQKLCSAADLQTAALERGLSFLAIAPDEIRAVFHFEISDADVDSAVAIVGEALQAISA